MPQSYSGTPSNVSSQNALDIIAATNTTPIAITTSVPHTWSTGDRLVVSDVQGNAGANSSPLLEPHPWTITVTGSTTFELDGSVGSGAYTSGGIATNVSLQPAFDEPLGGEPATVASILTAVNALADRSQYIQEQAERIGTDAPSSYLGAMNWGTPQIADGSFIFGPTPVAFDTFNARPAGNVPAFWSLIHNCWILCGSDTAGAFYYGDSDYWLKTVTAGSNKVNFGVSAANGNTVFFTTIAAGAAASVNYLLESPVGTYTDQVFPAASVVSQTLDAIVIQGGANAGRIVVVGARNNGSGNQYAAWTSDDHGVTFTAHDVAPLVAGSDALTRVIEGPNGALVAWTTMPTANGGDILYTSNDGVTWSATASIGFDLILDAVWVAPEEQFVFLRASELRVASVGSLSFVTIALPGVNLAIGCVGSLIILSASYAGTSPIAGTTETLTVGRMMGKTLAWVRPTVVANPYGWPYSYIATSPQGQMCATGYVVATEGFAQLSGKV